MLTKIKKDLILEGLDCANCSAKIENEVNQIEGVNAYMNFMTKTLTVETEDNKDFNNVLENIESIVKKHEPHVIVSEKIVKKPAKNTFILEGLGCANCASKMETQIKSLPGVNSASIDFVSKRLIIEAASTEDLRRIAVEAAVIVDRIESGVKLVRFDSTTKEKPKANESANKKELIQLGVGGALFAFGLIMNLPSKIELAVFLISYLIVGGEIVLRALKNIARGQVFDENFLMGIATIGAFIIGEYPEGVAVMLFYQVGELFQEMAVNRSRRSISSLMDIRPDFANLKSGDNITRVSPEDVIIGDIIVVKPGEKIPLDGTVIEGSSMVDTSALTGESVPRKLEPGTSALSGFINKNGVLTIEVTKEFAESTVSKILDLVQNASSRKAPTENFITKFARYYTPGVVFASLAIALIPPMVIQGASFSDWVYRALIFLVISCPCALVVSIPLSFFGGIGGASKRGVLVKGSNYLEALNNVETVIFDKTGTLTKGLFKVTEITPEDDNTKEDLLEYAAYAESYSNHPIATSIIRAYGKEIDKANLSDYEEISGHGIKVKLKDNLILVGNAKLMKKEDIKYSEVNSIGTIVHVALNKEYIGYIIISDEIKEDSKDAIRDLKSLGIKKIVMLTGDVKSVGEKVANHLGLDEVYSELLPTEKVENLELLDKEKSPKGKLIFVGDGINDAPVLARADIGIAMGGLGSDAAIEAADIVIMTDEPSKIATAIKVAKRTKIIVWQNIAFALGIKLLFIILGAFGIATMWEAVFADVGVAVIAVLNAMRVIKVDNI
ncbi:heavy metal translocating P-type ATPase [Clostridium cylindrosporum]|uniref:Cadmium, zinc and cobalt-transporting ATPase n=1 Tax=Clostridium cylindrosporum DSM 605 TaxID=1121307 RepID=A0A0J8D8W7_CLOCY|nr:heavy metal translocating P-type ATPase [Clostridium cylindrosporum]KMT22490.1 cadmium, zinc and cobalt-transporting ATPase [Clostridium cylindrosporum DSM 605]